MKWSIYILLAIVALSCSSPSSYEEAEPMIPPIIPLVEYNPAWSPDGEQIAYIGASIPGYIYRQNKPSGLYIYDIESKTDSLLVGNIDVDYPQWSPDGNLLIFVCYNFEICLYDLRTDSMSVVLSRDRPQYNGTSGYPRFIDSNILLLSVRLTSDEQLDLFTLNLETGELVRIFDSVPGVTDGGMVKGGYAYILTSGINYYSLATGKESTIVSKLRVANLEVIGENVLLYDDGETVYIKSLNSTEIPILKDGVQGADINNTGEMVYSRWAEEDGRLYIYDLDTSKKRLLIEE